MNGPTRTETVLNKAVLLEVAQERELHTMAGHTNFSVWAAGVLDIEPTYVCGQDLRYASWHRRIRTLAERGVADCGDLDDFTVRFAALADGLALQRLCQAPPLTIQAARRLLNRFVERELGRPEYGERK